MLNFEVYILQESIDFGSTKSIGKRPVSVDEVLHSQFKLDRLKYRDTNNFVRFNEVVVNDDMWAMQKEKPFHFLNYKQNPVF